MLDFNDLEHFTLAILQGEGQGSEASGYYRQKFEEVLVDEYQDVNRLQEAILYWVREPDDTQGNMFMVGDVKQSIYAFRNADIYTYLKAAKSLDEQQHYTMDINWRSTPKCSSDFFVSSH